MGPLAAILACNILVEGTSYVYTLSNHGRRLNCSVTTLFPASISLVSLDVGLPEQQNRLGRLSPRHHLIAQRSKAGGVVHNVSQTVDLFFQSTCLSHQGRIATGCRTTVFQVRMRWMSLRAVVSSQRFENVVLPFPGDSAGGGDGGGGMCN